MSLLNKLVEMDHDVVKSNSLHKMIAVENYHWWKDRFEEWMRFNGLRMWICISDGYMHPIKEGEGVSGRRILSYSEMDEEQKLMYEAENKARAAITMSLPQEILHTFRRDKIAK